MVHVVAHRGFSGKYPENTEIAFVKALDLGVEMVELDVHLARDGSLIVIHDSTVDRTSDGTGAVADLTRSQIKRLDAGSWLDREFEGVRFLTLQEALDILGGRTRLNVHIKAYEHDRERVCAGTLGELERRELLGGAFVASDADTIALAKRILPDVAVCNLSTEPKAAYIARSLSIGCRILQPGNAQVDRELVEEAHKHGMEVNPFYADDLPEMRRLIACGVDGILTNHPDRLLQLRDQL